MEPVVMTKQEYASRRDKALQSEPEWWKKTRTYEVQLLEGPEWSTKLSSDTEWVDDFKLIARNPFARILKNGVDVTPRYRENSSEDAAISRPSYGPTIVAPGPLSDSSKSSAMKPSEYKRLSQSQKEEIWRSVDTLLENKVRRADIFLQLNISEATYDTVRMDMKSRPSAASSEAPTIEDRIVENSITSEPKGGAQKLQKPSLLKRR